MDRQPVNEAIEKAQRLLGNRQFEEALAFLQVVVEQFPDDPEIRLLYATSLLAVPNADVAGEIIKAIGLDLDDPVRLIRAAAMLFDLGELSVARSYAEHAAKRAPVDFIFLPELTNLAGRLEALQGDDALAEEALRAAVEVGPRREAFARDLAVFLAARGRMQEAIATIDTALSLTSEIEELERLREKIVAVGGRHGV